jgi:hypothetical protein
MKRSTRRSKHASASRRIASSVGSGRASSQSASPCTSTSTMPSDRARSADVSIRSAAATNPGRSVAPGYSRYAESPSQT